MVPIREDQRQKKTLLAEKYPWFVPPVDSTISLKMANVQGVDAPLSSCQDRDSKKRVVSSGSKK